MSARVCEPSSADSHALLRMRAIEEKGDFPAGIPSRGMHRIQILVCLDNLTPSRPKGLSKALAVDVRQLVFFKACLSSVQCRIEICTQGRLID